MGQLHKQNVRIVVIAYDVAHRVMGDLRTMATLLPPAWVQQKIAHFPSENALFYVSPQGEVLYAALPNTVEPLSYQHFYETVLRINKAMQ